VLLSGISNETPAAKEGTHVILNPLQKPVTPTSTTAPPEARLSLCDTESMRGLDMSTNSMTPAELSALEPVDESTTMLYFPSTLFVGVRNETVVEAFRISSIGPVLSNVTAEAFHLPILTDSVEPDSGMK